MLSKNSPSGHCDARAVKANSEINQILDTAVAAKLQAAFLRRRGLSPPIAGTGAAPAFGEARP